MYNNMSFKIVWAMENLRYKPQRSSKIIRPPRQVLQQLCHLLWPPEISQILLLRNQDLIFHIIFHIIFHNVFLLFFVVPALLLLQTQEPPLQRRSLATPRLALPSVKRSPWPRSRRTGGKEGLNPKGDSRKKLKKYLVFIPVSTNAGKIHSNLRLFEIKSLSGKPLRIHWSSIQIYPESEFIFKIVSKKT